MAMVCARCSAKASSGVCCPTTAIASDESTRKHGFHY
jgi:hypothetical protein